MLQITGSLTISGSFSAFTLDSDNIVLGAGAGTNMLAGADSNVVLGNSAGATLTDGDFNVIIGDGADTNASNTTYAVAIGKGAQVTNANVAIGYNVTAESYDSMVAIGSSGGNARTTVIGKSSSTTGYGSQAFGFNVDSTATTAMAFGYNFTNALAGSFQVGSGAQKLTVTTNSNLLLNKSVTPTAATHFDDSATNVITIGTGSAPDANVAHSVQLYAQTGSSEAGLQLRTSGGKIHTLADKIDFTNATAISGSIFSGSFVGDGSQLTNLPASSTFPFTGDAQITGSLIVSGSFEPRGLGGETNVIIGGAGAGSSISEVYATHNVIIGYDAAEQLNDEDYNVIIGSSAGNFLTHGVNNVLIGGLTGRNLKGSTGNKIKGNTLIGHYAGYGGTNANSFSANNTGLGEKVLYEIDGGSGSIAIGYFAGYNIGSGNNNIIIGSGSLGTTTMNDQLRIGHADLHVISASLETGHIKFNSFDVNGSSRTLFTTASLVYSGSNVTQVTQSYEAGTTQKTSILYSGSFSDGNPLSVTVSGSDGVNKVYTLEYSASLVTQITVI